VLIGKHADALRYIDLMSDPETQATGYRAVWEELRTRRFVTEAQHAMAAAIEAGQRISWHPNRVAWLHETAAKLAQLGEYDQAPSTVERIDDSDRGETLAQAVDTLAVSPGREWLIRARSLAESIKDALSRILGLSSVASALRRWRDYRTNPVCCVRACA
jgi:hypothetical protein